MFVFISFLFYGQNQRCRRCVICKVELELITESVYFIKADNHIGFYELIILWANPPVPTSCYMYVSWKEGKEVGCFLHVRRPVQIPDLWRNCGITACQIYSGIFNLQYVLPPHPHTLSTVHTHTIV